MQARTRTQAAEILTIVKAREQRDKALGVRTQTEMTLAELLAHYKRHQKSRVRPTTFARVDGIIAVLTANLPQQARSLTRKHVADYITLRTATVSPATIFKEVTTLKHCLRLAVEWELLHTNVALGASLPKTTQGRTRFLSPNELKVALEAAPEWLRAPVALSVATGMRRGEVLQLRWTDVDLPGRRMYLRATKNGSLRVLALNELACRVLGSLPREEGSLVFPGIHPMRLTDNTRSLFKRLGIEDASFHTLRHTAASWMVMEGVDLYGVGQMLGHKTPAMTQRYSHLTPEYQAAAAGKLDGVFGDIMPRTRGLLGD